MTYQKPPPAAHATVTNAPGPKPHPDDGQNTAEGQRAAQNAQNDYERSIGNIESVPIADRTPEDWRAYLKQLKGRIEDYNKSGCIAKEDQAFAAMIVDYNDVLSTRLGETYTVSEKDFNHAPWCTPLNTSGTSGARR